MRKEHQALIEDMAGLIEPSIRVIDRVIDGARLSAETVKTARWAIDKNIVIIGMLNKTQPSQEDEDDLTQLGNELKNVLAFKGR